MPGCIDFYIEALKFIAFARTFLAYTYALAYRIKNKRESDLFTMTQSMLEFSIERFDKYIDDNPIDNLIHETEVGVCQSDLYSKMLSDVSSLSLNMKIQFENAKKEFTSEEFLRRIVDSEDKGLMEMEIPDEIGEGEGKNRSVNNKWLVRKMMGMFSSKKNKE